MPPINEWFEKKYVPGPRKQSVVAEVGLDIIVDRLGYLSGNRHAGIAHRKAVFAPLGVHLPAGADCAVDFGDKINLVFADFVRLRLSAGLLVFSGKTFLR